MCSLSSKMMIFALQQRFAKVHTKNLCITISTKYEKMEYGYTFVTERDNDFLLNN